MEQYRIAAWLLGIGLVLWALTWGWNHTVGRHAAPGTLGRPGKLAERHGDSTRN